MFELALGFVVGLVIGWNVFPQPRRVQEWWARLFNKGE